MDARTLLTELNPRWVQGSQWTDSRGSLHFPAYDLAHPRNGMGMSFDCPTHRNHRLAIFFANPVDGLPPDDRANHLWNREGDTFETITVAPSIDASVHGCWHGFITAGEIR